MGLNINMEFLEIIFHSYFSINKNRLSFTAKLINNNHNDNKDTGDIWGCFCALSPHEHMGSGEARIKRDLIYLVFFFIFILLFLPYFISLYFRVHTIPLVCLFLLPSLFMQFS